MGLARTALALVALASIGLGVARVWPELGRQHDRYSRWSDSEIRLAGALHEHLDADRFERLRGYARPGVRYCLDADFVSRTFAVYWLLPAVPASCSDAGVRLPWPGS
jgi:hypothetical protein